MKHFDVTANEHIVFFDNQTKGMLHLSKFITGKIINDF